MFIVVFFYVMQRHIIYFPLSYFPSPAEAGVPQMRIVTLHTADGLALKAWYHPPIHSRLPTLIYVHGNAGHIGHRAMMVKPFLEEGYGVLLLTYRGYSGNPGKPTEQGLYQDARAALDFVHQHTIPNHCIVLYGNSIGTAVAIQMATEYPIGAMILQAPFPSLADVGQVHYPFLPIKPLLKDKFDSIKKVEKLKAPVLVIHGESDWIIPPKLSRQLFNSLPEPKQAKYTPDKGHNDLYEPAHVIQFIQEYVQCND